MRVAILGATGAVGTTMLRVLEERATPIDEIVPLASARSAGRTVTWRGKEWQVREPSAEAFRGCAVALFSAGATRSREWAPIATAEGAVVVDNSSAWRMDPDVPLVVPEVNGARVRDAARGIIANPNCVTTQLVLALEAIRRVAGLRRVVASSYQSVSGAGQKGVAALEAELAGRAVDGGSPFPAPIAGNVIPCIGASVETGWTEEEEKVRHESRKILELPALEITATCVRVPVAIGHAVAAAVEMERPITVEEARHALAAMPGLAVDDSAHGPLPRDVAGHDVVRVGRVRQDPDSPRILHLWIVGDNLRKGATTNAVQIAEQVLDG